MNTIKSDIEFFHLVFLDKLSRNIDNSLYAVKGGCNLRFFFNSIRYSEDLDIDAHIISTETLKKKVNKIINETPLQQILKTRGISIDAVSLPKQTQTTQRWKLILKTNASLPINTKIEFSCRHTLKETLYEPVNASIIQTHQLTPIFCTHHHVDAAFRQKIEALAGRPQTQARDVFDLFLLINAGAGLTQTKPINHSVIISAKDNAELITFEAFNSQVVAFLSSEYQEQYHSKTLWQQIVMRVIKELESLKS